MNCNIKILTVAAIGSAAALTIGCSKAEAEAPAADEAEVQAAGEAVEGAMCDLDGNCAEGAAEVVAEAEEMAEDEIDMSSLFGGAPDAEPELAPETVLVEIGGAKLTVADADAELLKVFGGQANIEQIRPLLARMRPQAAMNFVAKTLVEAEIAKRGATASDEEIDAEIAKIVEANPLPEGKTLEGVITEQGGTMAEFRDNIAMKVKVEKLIDQPSAAEVADFYTAHKADFEMPAQASARHILISIDENDTDEQKAEKKAKAEDLLKQVKDGADFAELAKANSDCPSKERGGDLGTFGRGQMVPEFDQAVFEQPVGVVGEIVETQFGYHVIEITNREEGGMPPFEELKERIENVLRGQAFGKLLDNLRKSADIKFHDSIKGMMPDEEEEFAAEPEAAPADEAPAEPAADEPAAAE